MSAHASTQRANSREEDRAPVHVEGNVELPRFDQIYEEHFDFVWRSMRRLGVPEAHVDDAVQEAFLVAHRRLPTFEGRSSLRSWIFGIVSNVARDHHRSTRRKDPTARVDADGPAVDALPDRSSPSPHDSLERADAARLLHELLLELDWDKREAFVLVELEQMSIVEIAAALGANSNTVYSRVRSARRAFNQAVERYHARERRRSP